MNWMNIFRFKKIIPGETVKQEIKYKNLTIKLYAYKVEDGIKAESNIEAFDLQGNLVWRAQNCPHGRYWEMQFDEANDQLETNNGGGMHYTIDLRNGAMLSEQLIK